MKSVRVGAVLTLVMALLLIPAAVSLADNNKMASKEGIWAKVGPAPKDGSIAGPIDISVYYVQPDDGWTHIWLDRNKLYDRFSVENNNEENMEWLTPSEADRKPAWNWKIAGKIGDVVVGDMMEEPITYVNVWWGAIASGSKAVVLVRRSYEMVSDNKRLDPNKPIDAAALVKKFLNWPEPWNMIVRMEAVLCTFGPESVIKLTSLEDTLTLQGGPKACMKAVRAKTLEQEAKVSVEAKDWMEKLVKAGD